MQLLLLLRRLLEKTGQPPFTTRCCRAGIDIIEYFSLGILQPSPDQLLSPGFVLSHKLAEEGALK